MTGKKRIQAVVLAGGPQASAMEKAIGIPVLAIPVRSGTSMLEAWSTMISRYEEIHKEMAVVVSDPRQLDLLGGLRTSVPLKSLLDPRPHRGTGGVLADLFFGEDQVLTDCDYVLVLERTACPLKSIDRLMADLSHDPDVVIGVSRHDRLAGVMAIRPDVLRLVPRVGYSDLKEQVVAVALENGKKIVGSVLVDEVVRVDHLQGVLESVRLWHDDPIGATGSTSTEIHGACSIHPSVISEGATVIDSVCLEGAVISPGAVVARSIVGRWAKIPAGATVVDSIISRNSD